MSLKTQRLIYTAKNFEAGLTDVTASIRRNGASVATGVALSEVSLGRYELVLSPATITGYGGAGYFDFYINSASKSAPATASRWILENDEDDLRAGQLAVEAKVDIIDTNVDAIKADVQSGTFGLAALKALIDSVQSSVSNIQNATRFVAAIPANLIKPSSGSTSYRIPIRVYNGAGALEDPDTNSVAVSITDESGNDKTSYLAGFVAGPVNATRTGVGVYYIDMAIPSTADLEQLNFNFAYSEASVAISAVRTSQVISDTQASGFALETTAQDILTDTADMQPRVNDIQTKINSATFGLSALKDLIDILDLNVDSTLAAVNNGTYGLSAIKTALDSKASQASVTAVQTTLDSDVKGTGFSNTTDSLKAISDRIYTGGEAV